MAKNIHKVNDFVICGGVSANSFLREKLKEIEHINRIKTYVPKINYSKGLDILNIDIILLFYYLIFIHRFTLQA